MTAQRVEVAGSEGRRVVGDVPNQNGEENPPEATVADRAALAASSALPARRAAQLECGRRVTEVLHDHSLRGLKSPRARASKVFRPSTSSSPAKEHGRGSAGGRAALQ